MKRPIRRAPEALPIPRAREEATKLSARANERERAARELEDRKRALNAHIRARRASKKAGERDLAAQHHERVIAHRQALAGAKPEEQSE